MGTLNGVLSPVAHGTSAILDSQTFDMLKYQQQKDKLEYEAMLRDPSKAYLVSDEEFDKRIEELGWTDTFTIMGMYIERLWYNIGQKVRDFFRILLELLFQAASLTVDTIRTFFLVVLTILGPISFALSIYDGFQSTLMQWLSRYISIYMWLPVSDLFGAILAKIQILMLQQDIALLEDPAYIPDGSNTVYCIFLIIGILGYFCVPTVASWIVQTAGAGNYTSRLNSVVMMAGGTAATLGGVALGKTIGGGKKLAKAGYGKWKKWRQKRKANKRKKEQPEQSQT